MFILLSCQFPALFAQDNHIDPGARHAFNGIYAKKNINRIAFPIGGMGAGMLCIEGTGAVSHMSVRNRLDIFNEPVMFGAIVIKGRPSSARVLEGPVPDWKKFGMCRAGKGAPTADWGWPGLNRLPSLVVSLLRKLIWKTPRSRLR
jgi:hypothetical protein